MIKERGPVNWGLLRKRKKTTEYGETHRATKQVVKDIMKTARAKNSLIPRTPIEALVLLRHTRSTALKPLIQIYLTHGWDLEKATQIATSQIKTLWDSTVKSINIRKRYEEKKSKK